MKIISLNVATKIDNVEAIIQFLHEQDADIVCLQELSRGGIDTKDMFNKKKFLDEEFHTIYPYEFWGGLCSRTKVTDGRMVGGVMELGNYIMSKYPFITAKQQFYFRQFEYVPVSVDPDKNDFHGRALTIGHIQTPQGNLQVINVHGVRSRDKLGDERSIKQTDEIMKAIDPAMPCVIIGDFNLLPETEEIKLLSKHLTNTIELFGISSTRPDFKDGFDKGNMVVDYCFVSKDIEVSLLEVPHSNFSDHLPLIVQCNIRAR